MWDGPCAVTRASGRSLWVRSGLGFAPPSLARRGRETPAPGPGQGTSRLPQTCAPHPAPAFQLLPRVSAPWAPGAVKTGPRRPVPCTPVLCASCPQSSSAGRRCREPRPGRVSAVTAGGSGLDHWPVPLERRARCLLRDISPLGREEALLCGGQEERWGTGIFSGPWLASPQRLSAARGAQLQCTVAGRRLALPGSSCSGLSACATSVAEASVPETSVLAGALTPCSRTHTHTRGTHVAHTGTQARACACPHRCRCAITHACTRSHMHTRAHTHSAHARTCTHTHIHTLTCACPCARTRAHTPTHIQTHTHTGTHTWHTRTLAPGLPTCAHAHFRLRALRLTPRAPYALSHEELQLRHSRRAGRPGLPCPQPHGQPRSIWVA